MSMKNLLKTSLIKKIPQMGKPFLLFKPLGKIIFSNPKLVCL